MELARLSLSHRGILFHPPRHDASASRTDSCGFAPGYRLAAPYRYPLASTQPGLKLLLSDGVRSLQPHSAKVFGEP